MIAIAFEVSKPAPPAAGSNGIHCLLELCERSNQCDAIYPSCTVATPDYTLLIDYSGTIVGLRDGYDARLESRQ